MKKMIMITLMFLAALYSSADELKIGISNQGDGSVQKPAMGLSQLAVEEKFGQPSKMYEPTGKPPITRWQYESFSVYFEGDYVIHSVVHHVDKRKTKSQKIESEQ